MNNESEFYEHLAKDLFDSEKFKVLSHHTLYNTPLPSIDALIAIVDDLKEILFPGFYGHYEQHMQTFFAGVSHKLEEIENLLEEQITRGFCLSCAKEINDCESCKRKAAFLAKQFIKRLPEIKHLLSKDVVAAFNGDPAAKNYEETILCYPSIVALTYYRIAHELYKLGINLIPRMITEISHSKTGIDIHPAASIGEEFFIDHGTGVVIGETTIIGKNVRLYQGVTLGAKSFPLDENGNPVKNIPRHPILRDNVIVYSNATILGRITIGENTVIGGNIWVTSDVPPNSKVLQNKDIFKVFDEGAGI
jgi:serine O-acetyltransferase